MLNTQPLVTLESQGDTFRDQNFSERLKEEDDSPHFKHYDGVLQMKEVDSNTPEQRSPEEKKSSMKLN